MNDHTKRLIEITELAKSYCELCEMSSEYNREEFTERALDLLPRLYWNFYDLESTGVILDDSIYYSSYVDEEIYDSIKNGIARVMGEEDVYLDTFMEDMQYSDMPISASVSEGMADIYQSLFNFVSIVKDSEGSQMEEAYIQCKEDFENYWSQTLCNLLKVFNNLKYSNHINNDEI